MNQTQRGVEKTATIGHLLTRAGAARVVSAGQGRGARTLYPMMLALALPMCLPLAAAGQSTKEDPAAKQPAPGNTTTQVSPQAPKEFRVETSGGGVPRIVPATKPAQPAGPAKAVPVPSEQPTAVPGQKGAAPVGPKQPAPAQPNPALGAQGNKAAAPGQDMSGEGIVQPEGGTPDAEALSGGLLGPDGLPPLTDEDTITLAAFSEPVQLTALINLLVATLNINLTVVGDPQGSVMFNAPVPIKKKDLLALVDSLLSQSGWTITQDPTTQWYSVVQEGNVPVSFTGAIATTKVISTPNVRPSAVIQAVQSQLGGGGGIPGQPGQPGQPGGSGGKMQAFDELGIIIVTDTVRRIASVETLVAKIMEEYNKAQYIRVEVFHLAAPAARDRVLMLMGQGSAGTRGGFGGDPNQAAIQQQQARLAGANLGGGGSAGALENITDRLTVDPSGNALIFRGMPGEIERVKEILAIIDVHNVLQPKRFFAGSMAMQIASMAQQRGMGQVTTISASTTNDPNQQVQFQNQQFNNQFNRQGNMGFGGGSQEEISGGPLMVVDEVNGNIIYYGTPSQHDNLDKLIKELDIQSERIVIKEYKLKNSKAEDVADVILGLINNQSLVGDSTLLPDGNLGGESGFGSRSSNRRSSRFNRSSSQNQQINQPRVIQQGGEGSGDGIELDGSNAFVIADIKNNQILVKAPAGQQETFGKLIEKIDLRRPQVYLEVQIVAVTWSDELRVAFETQLINSNGTGGALQTNFGLTTAGSTFTDRRNVATGLSGLTAAIIKSDQLPIVVNALQTKADTRILSSPAMLVDDNENAEIVSTEDQPYSTTQVTTGAPNTTSFGGYESAGTKLSVTPSIAEDGYLRLEYEAELSSFTQNVGLNGSPPPKLVNNVSSTSVTVPGDATIIVGGLNVDTKRISRIQVPLLGDIPLIGHLFQDYSRTGRITTLYVFMTPRIMREPNFADLKLLSEGPQKRAKVEADYPVLKPTAMEINAMELINTNNNPVDQPVPEEQSPNQPATPAAQPTNPQGRDEQPQPQEPEPS